MGTLIDPGDIITAYGTRGIDDRLTHGRDYVCLYGTEPGMVPDKPYVTVIDDNGNEFSTHQSRFENLLEARDD